MGCLKDEEEGGGRETQVFDRRGDGFEGHVSDEASKAHEGGSVILFHLPLLTPAKYCRK